MRRNQLTLLLLSLSLTLLHLSGAHAQPHSPPNKTLKLQEAIWMALRHNPNVRSQKMQRVIDKFNLRVAQNAYELNYALSASSGYTHTVIAGNEDSARATHLKPGVSLRTHWGTTFSGDVQNNYDHGRYRPSINFDLRQPLMRGFGRRIADIDLLNAQDAERISKLNLRENISQTVVSVIKDYRQLIQSKERLLIQQRNLKDSVDSLQQVRTKIKAGVLAPRDTVVAERQIAEQRLALRVAQNTYLQNKLKLLRNLWLPTQTHITLDNVIRIPRIKLPSISQAQQRVLKKNLAYQQQLLQLNERIRRKNKAYDDSRWQLDLRAHQTFSNGTHSGLTPLTRGRNQESSLSLNLQIPIHDLHNKQAQINADTQLKQAKLMLAVKRRELQDDIEVRLRAIDSQRTQLTLAKSAEKLAAQSLTLAKKKQLWGHGTIEDVTNARSHLIDLQTRVLNTKIAFLNSITDLNALLGQIPQVWHIPIRY